MVLPLVEPEVELPLVVRPEVLRPEVVRLEPEVVRPEVVLPLRVLFITEPAGLRTVPPPALREVMLPVPEEVVEPEVMVPEVEPLPEVMLPEVEPLPEVMLPDVLPEVILPEVELPEVMPPEVVLPVVVPLVVPLVVLPEVPPVVVPWSRPADVVVEDTATPAEVSMAANRAVPRKNEVFFIAQKERVSRKWSGKGVGDYSPGLPVAPPEEPEPLVPPLGGVVVLGELPPVPLPVPSPPLSAPTLMPLPAPCWVLASWPPGSVVGVSEPLMSALPLPSWSAELAVLAASDSVPLLQEPRVSVAPSNATESRENDDLNIVSKKRK